MQEFFAMGGYAAFVWPAFGITTAVLILNIVTAVRHDRKVLERNQRRLRTHS